MFKGLSVAGQAIANPTITGGSINNTPIGATTPSTGAFTTLASASVAGTDGVVRLADPVVTEQVITPMTGAATIAVAAIQGGIITANPGTGGNVAYTLPTGAVFATGTSSSIVLGDTAQFSITNTSTVAAETVTVTAASTFDIVGNAIINANTGGTVLSFGSFKVIKTGATAYSAIRVG